LGAFAEPKVGLGFMISKEMTKNTEKTASTFITNIEKMWLQQGEAHLLLNQLKLKFNSIPEEYINKIKEADTNTLDKWGANFVFANSLDEVFKQ
jgi:Domain of unknown function (DUF4351)